MAAQLLQAAELLEAQRLSSPMMLVAPDPDVLVPCFHSYDDGETGSGNDSDFDEDTASSTSPTNARNNKPYKRQGPRDPGAHNSVEKRRRAFLADCYSRLKEVIPSIKQLKTSNALVLNGAADYVVALQAEERALLTELNRQKEINRVHLAKSKRSQRHFVPAREEASDNERVVPGQAPTRGQARPEDGFQTAPSSPVTTVEEQPVLGLMLLAELLANTKYHYYPVLVPPPRPHGMLVA